MNKMGAAQCGFEEHKKYSEVGAREGEWEDTVASQKYTPVLRARGV
jgi:hypothetical protein